MFSNPNGIQIHQPRVARNELPWVTFPKMFSTLKALHPFRRLTPNAPEGWRTPRRFAQVGRAVLCPPPVANERARVHHDGAHGVARPTIRASVLDCGGPPPLFTANHANHAKIQTKFPFASLASFVARPPPPQLVDSLAPARSALAGLRLCRIPFAASQAAQVRVVFILPVHPA